MAKQYAYYLEGNKMGLVEKDTSFDNNIESKEFGPGVARYSWKSAIETVTDGLKVRYAYSPEYNINNLSDIETGITGYIADGGFLKFTGSGLSTDATIDYIVVKDMNTSQKRFNGLHKITTLNANYWLTATPYNNTSSVTDGINAYTDVTPILDENFEIDLPSYLQKALVYYIKGRLAEDSMDLKAYEYFMRQYKKIIEKHESTRIAGPRIISSGSHAIR